MYYVSSLFSFLCLFFILKYLSYKLKLIDKPNYRKKHNGDIPLIGGLIVYLNIFLFSFFFEVSETMNNILYASILLIILGALDDAIELGVIFRLLTQFICCLILVGSGLVIKDIGNYMFFSNLEIGYLSILFTVFCIIGLTNAFNFIDGVDGLCSGIALISIISILVIALLNNSYMFLIDFEFLILVSTTLIFFIFFNVTRFSKAFLGDAGSIFLGFFIACVLILTSQNEYQIIHPILTLWCVTLPVFDITSVVIRRSLRKINPFKPDRRHVHHILIELGFSNLQTTILILIIAIILNFFGILIFYISGAFPALLSFIILLFLYVILMINLSRIANAK